MLSAWILLLLHTVCFPLRLGNSGSFPRPLKAEEEREYLARVRAGRSGGQKQVGRAQSPLSVSHS